MEISYQLHLVDYLKHNLFWLSKNKVFMVKRRNRIIKISVLYGIIYLFSFYFEIGFPYFQYAFPIIGITFLIYEFYYGEKRTLEKAHKKMILDEHSHLFNKTNVLTFENTFLIKNNDISNLKVDYEKIELIEELNEYFYFKIKSGDRIILPKSYIFDLPTFYHFLNKITKHYELNLVDETKWKWRYNFKTTDYTFRLE